jgi:hypothetical protein
MKEFYLNDLPSKRSYLKTYRMRQQVFVRVLSLLVELDLGNIVVRFFDQFLGVSKASTTGKLSRDPLRAAIATTS